MRVQPKIKQRLLHLRSVLLPQRGSRVHVPRQDWERDAQPGEFQFHRENRWRQTEDFVAQTESLLQHFGFDPHDYDGRTVLDLGAGSKLRTKFFRGARLVVIEPLADRFRSEIDWCDLDDASEVHSVPAEELVNPLVGSVDLLVSINVLDHCFDFEAIARNIREYLAHDGLAFVSFDKHDYADKLHPLTLTERSATEIFERADLVVERMTTGLGDALGGPQTYGHGPYVLNFWLRRHSPA